jgi:WD40-like Beta Propeller Repeat.
MIALAVVAALTLSLMNGDIPFRTGTPGGGGDGGGDGPTPSPAPSNVVITPPSAVFPGSITYAKAGNIWIQSGKDAHQVTNDGDDSMPTFSADGQWIYFIRVERTGGKFPTGGFQNPSYYDLNTPVLFRIKPDGTGAKRLLTGRYTQGTYTWFYWLTSPSPARTERRSR